MTQKPCPYPGLRPFTAKEADLFFGREEQVDALLKKLEQNRFVSVIGPSGCGKSSLVHAGLIPALHMGFLLSAGENWRMAIMRPGASPMMNLAKALSKAIHIEQPDCPETIAFIHASLRRGPLGLRQIIQETSLPDDTRIFFLVDQFEEIFLLTHQGNQEEAIAFVNGLLATIQDPNLYVCLTMRSDYLGDCAQFMGLPEAMNDSQFLTPRLTRDQRRAAITGPAAMIGGKVENALVNRILNDMGPDPDQLPLFQHALMRMWTMASLHTDTIHLTLADYQQLGGIQNALSLHADAMFKDLTPEQQHIAHILFRTLTDSASDRPDTRRPARIQETAHITKCDWHDVAKVVDRFRRVECSFLMPPHDIPLTENSVIDISHESLIRQWHMLQQWARQEKNDAVTYMRLEDAAIRWQEGTSELLRGRDLDSALEWEKNHFQGPEWSCRYGTHCKLVIDFLSQSEKKQTRSKRNRIIGLSALFIFIVGACVTFFGLWQHADQAKKHANEMTQSMLIQKITAIAQKEMALKAIKTLTYELVDQLKDIPGTLSFLPGILETNLSYLDRIYQLSPEDQDTQRERASNLDRMGDIWLLLGNTNKGLECYEMSLEISKKIAESDPTSAQAQRDLFTSYGKLGVYNTQLGNIEKAIEIFQQAFPIALLLSNDHMNQQAQNDLKTIKNDLFSLYFQKKQYHAIIHCLQAIIDAKKQPDANLFGSLSWYSLFNGQYEQGIHAAEKGLALDPNQIWIATNLMHGHMFLGHIEKAKEIYKTYHHILIQGKSFSQTILDDYEIFNQQGISSNYMTLMAKFIAE